MTPPSPSSSVDLDLDRGRERRFASGTELLLAPREVVAAALELGGEALEPLVALGELLLELGERLAAATERLGDGAELGLPPLDLGEAHRRVLRALGADASASSAASSSARRSSPAALALIELGAAAVELGGLGPGFDERRLDDTAALGERALGGCGRVGAGRDGLLDALELALALAQLVGRVRGCSLRLLLRAFPGHQARLSFGQLADLRLARRELLLAGGELGAQPLELERPLLRVRTPDVGLRGGLADLRLARRERELALGELRLECGGCGGAELQRRELRAALRALGLLALERFLRAMRSSASARRLEARASASSDSRWRICSCRRSNVSPRARSAVRRRSSSASRLATSASSRSTSPFWARASASSRSAVSRTSASVRSAPATAVRASSSSLVRAASSWSRLWTSASRRSRSAVASALARTACSSAAWRVETSVLEAREACLGAGRAGIAGVCELAGARGLGMRLDEGALALGELRHDLVELRVPARSVRARGALRLAGALELGLELGHACSPRREIVARTLALAQLVSHAGGSGLQLGELRLELGHARGLCQHVLV